MPKTVLRCIVTVMTALDLRGDGPDIRVPALRADRQMLALVREAKGWSQRELAVNADVSQSTLSKAENGLMELKGEALTQVAAALDCPVSLLAHEVSAGGLDVTCLHHRRRASRLTVASKNKVEALAHLTRLSVENLLPPEARLPVGLPRVEGLDPVDPAGLAGVVRVALGISEGPVRDLTQALEKGGVIVVVRPLGSAAQDAVSSWPHEAGRPPVLVVNSGLPGDRQRFTVAHELGHLVMHRLPGEDQEREADAFAAELLAPAEQVRPDLEGLTTADLRRLAALKPVWGMSIAALVRRAADVGVISERQYREFHLRLNRMGWRQSEPIALAPEQPRVLEGLLRSRLEAGASVADLARTALMTEASFVRYFPVADVPSKASGAGNA
jgi:Zn-dependent peptidase ImmA (M78 family)/transcriptional regulator with XRE-family HTH domain